MVTSTITASDTVIWDPESPNNVLEMAWPVFHESTHTFLDSIRNLGHIVSILGQAGYDLKTVETSRTGFLWLRTTRKFVFVKPVTCTKHGVDTSYAGMRESPSVTARNSPSISEFFKRDLVPTPDDE